MVDECDKNITDSFLCEKDVTEMGRTGYASEIYIRPVDWLGNGSHVTCPSGHVTLKLLACDVQSACWAKTYVRTIDIRDVPSPASCPAPLTSLPPSMTCRNGAEAVTYSLLCDGRSDCSDSSDEDFCVMPPCSESQPLQCSVTKRVKTKGI